MRVGLRLWGYPVPVPVFPSGAVSVGARAYPAWPVSVLRQIQSERIGGDVCTDSMELTVLSQSIAASWTAETKCVRVARLE